MKKKKGEAVEVEQKEVETIEVVDEVEEAQSVEPTEEVDTIIFTSEAKAVIAKAEIEIKPIKNVSEISDKDMVWVNKGNYQARCLKSWAIARGYEIIGRA